MPKINQTAAIKPVSPKAKPSKVQDDAWEFEQFVNQPERRAIKRNNRLVPIILLIILVVLAASVLYTFKFRSSESSTLKYKAVYLDNGQVYYAKAVKEDNLNIYLDDVYYVESQNQTLPPEKEGGDPQTVSVPVLVKRTDAAYKPQGLLQINRQKVVAIEGLADDSKILEEIQKLNK